MGMLWQRLSTWRRRQISPCQWGLGFGDSGMPHCLGDRPNTAPCHTPRPPCCESIYETRGRRRYIQDSWHGLQARCLGDILGGGSCQSHARMLGERRQLTHEEWIVCMSSWGIRCTWRAGDDDALETWEMVKGDLE